MYAMHDAGKRGCVSSCPGPEVCIAHVTEGISPIVFGFSPDHNHNLLFSCFYDMELVVDIHDWCLSARAVYNAMLINSPGWPTNTIYRHDGHDSMIPLLPASIVLYPRSHNRALPRGPHPCVGPESEVAS